MFIVNGEAVGSILHSALTKEGKPRKAVEGEYAAKAEALDTGPAPEDQPPGEPDTTSRRSGAASVRSSDVSGAKK